VIYITHFCEHSIEMNAVDGRPSKGSQPSVVQADGDEFAWKLKLEID